MRVTSSANRDLLSRKSAGVNQRPLVCHGSLTPARRRVSDKGGRGKRVSDNVAYKNLLASIVFIHKRYGCSSRLGGINAFPQFAFG